MRREFLLAETLVYCGVLPSTKLLVHLVHSVVLWACVAMFWIWLICMLGLVRAHSTFSKHRQQALILCLAVFFGVHCTGFVVMFPIPMK